MISAGPSPTKELEYACHTFTSHEFLCPICMELLYSPRTPSCGHTFCEHCLQSWIDQNDNNISCPVDRKSLSPSIPDVNLLLQELIRIAFPNEYKSRGEFVAEVKRSNLLRELRYIFCRSPFNTTMVKVLKSDDTGFLQTEELITAMLLLPRGEFVPPSLRQDAYELRPSRIEALGFNISAPNMYSLCLEILKPLPGHSFLDIGSGCGLLTALAGHMVGPEGFAHGIDIKDEILGFSKRNLAIQKRRVTISQRQYETHKPCPRTGRIIPGSTFVGFCSEQDGKTSYPAKLRIDSRDGNKFDARFYWQTFGRTVTFLQGTINDEVNPDDSSTLISVHIVEKQALFTRLDSVHWLPCSYSLQLDSATGRLFGSFSIHVVRNMSTLTKLDMQHMDLPLDLPFLDNVEFYKANCFQEKKLPMSKVIKERGGYDRIHCGAACPQSLLNRLTRLLAPGGIMMLPMGNEMNKVEKSKETGDIKVTSVLAVRYGELVLPNENEDDTEKEDDDEMLLDGKNVLDTESESRKKRRLEGDESEVNSEVNTEVKTEPSPVVTQEPSPATQTYAYYSKCCNKGVVPTGSEVPEEAMIRSFGEVLELADGKAILCTKVDGVVDDEFQYISPVLNGLVCHVVCEYCRRHLGVRFLGEPEERGEQETYDGRLLIARSYLRTEKQETEVAEPIQCKNCNSYLSNPDQVLSIQHRWTLEGATTTEPAAYINWIDPQSITEGESKEAKMTQGTSSYSTIFCKSCQSEVGWKFLGHIHYHERAPLSWYSGRYGLVISKVTNIKAPERGILTLTLVELMHHLALAGLLRNRNNDNDDDDEDDGNSEADIPNL